MTIPTVTLTVERFTDDSALFPAIEALVAAFEEYDSSDGETADQLKAALFECLADLVLVGAGDDRIRKLVEQEGGPRTYRRGIVFPERDGEAARVVIIPRAGTDGLPEPHVACEHCRTLFPVADIGKGSRWNTPCMSAEDARTCQRKEVADETAALEARR